MSKRKNTKNEKISKVFTAGLLLAVLYSKPSFSIIDSIRSLETSSENYTFLAQTLSSDTFTSLIKILSHFFPSFHGILEELLPKHIKKNQQPLNFIGVGKKSLTSLSSSRGKYRNLQTSAQALIPVLRVSSPSILEKSGFMHSSFKLNSEMENKGGQQGGKSFHISGDLYSLEEKTFLSSLYKRQHIGLVSEVFREVKINLAAQNQEEMRHLMPSYSHVNFFTKTQIPSIHLDEGVDEIHQEIIKSFESEESKKVENLNINDVSQVPLRGISEEGVEEPKNVLSASDFLSVLSETNKPLLTPLKTYTPKKPVSKHVRSKPTILDTLATEDTFESLSDQDGTIPQIASIPPKLPQSQFRSDKLPQNHKEAITAALQKNKINLSEKSTVIVALQRIVKDSKLKIIEIPELIEKLSQGIDELIKKTYKIAPEKFKNLILQLIQPRYHIVTDVDFNQRFEELSQAVFELWRAKLLTDYIEKGSEEVLEKPLPTSSDMSPFVNKVIDDRFNHEVDSKLGPQMKQNARITIDATVKNGSLYSSESQFSTEDKRAILSQVFKLLVLDPSFKLPTLVNSRNNQDIDQDKLREMIKPYITLAVEQLYGLERVKSLNVEAEPENNSMPLKASIPAKKILSVEEIIKKAEPWLITRLFELLPGNTKEEKIDFLINITSQDEILTKIRTEIVSCSEEDKLIQLKRREEEVSKRTYGRIMETIMEELGSQDFTGSPLKLAIAFYRDAKLLIEDYLNTSSGFVAAIEQTLKQPLKETQTSSEIYTLVKNIMYKGKYKIQTRIDGKRYVETPPLEAPKFVFLFSLPYWLVLKERLIKREERNKQLIEQAQLKRKVLSEKLNEFFFGGKIFDLTQRLEDVFQGEEKSFSKGQVQDSISIPLKIDVSSSIIGAPPPPPPPSISSAHQELKSINNAIVEIRKGIQKSLKSSGLAVKETSLILELLLRYKLQNEHMQTSDIVNKFYEKFIAIFYRTLNIDNKENAHKKFASQLGIKNSGQLVRKLTQSLDEELQSYFLASLTVENMDSISAFGVQTQDSLKKFNAKATEITTTFLKTHFQAALKQFKIEPESSGKNLETLEVFLKEELSKLHLKYTGEEKLELVLGTFVHMLNTIDQNPSFVLPIKVSEKDNSQFILNIEAFKPAFVGFLNEVITKKFKGNRPHIKIPEYNEDIKIEPSKVLPYLGKLFLEKAFDILPGENQELKINNLIKADSKQLSSLIDDTLNLLCLTSYHYKTSASTEATIVFTEHTLKIFKEVITERYIALSASLDSSCRNIIKSSKDPLSLFSSLLTTQLGINGSTPKKHRISMSSPHDRKKKIETEETINAFDILLSLPSLWQRKNKLEIKKKFEAEEQERKEREMTHRIQFLRQFISSEIEILS
ncbi:hypothetical protein IM40_00100 [Candidatus Paracaedimonas acanthamoebae]|nr:hypothetical protein IM40_00100 [Candidatus Paracaedimonas acanthamoebae]